MFIATNQIWETPRCCKKDVHPRRTERVINALYGSKDDCCQLAFCFMIYRSGLDPQAHNADSADFNTQTCQNLTVSNVLCSSADCSGQVYME